MQDTFLCEWITLLSSVIRNNSIPALITQTYMVISTFSPCALGMQQVKLYVIEKQELCC